MNSLVADIKFGARMLLKSKTMTIIALLALTLGIGANTAIFSVVNAVLLRSFPYSDADRIVLVWEKKQGGRTDQNVKSFAGSGSRFQCAEPAHRAREFTARKVSGGA